MTTRSDIEQKLRRQAEERAWKAEERARDEQIIRRIVLHFSLRR
jgi:hypothetical protein